ncbi:hypothetical protein B0T11DRAFT_135342 [Plectosphaerella cucumerina]|uniref:Uncharacterized protein n=1 Tax=Plectosphaerella cucumerina TaxID=40658 RepID=A0A8K0TAN2_9PEZI|nr:hypothetical protein B0T11DRAFT_135342 [Plectosphaerella cucumerina]
MHLYTNLIHSRMAAPQRHHRSASFHLFRHQARSSGTKSPFQFFSFHPSTTGGGAPKVSDRDSRRHLLFYLFEFSFDTTHILMHERQEEEGPRTDWAAAGAKAMGSMDGGQLSWFWNDHWQLAPPLVPRRRAGLSILSPESRSMVIRATDHGRAEEAGFDRSRSLPSREVGVIPGRSTPSSAMLLHDDPGVKTRWERKSSFTRRGEVI